MTTIAILNLKGGTGKTVTTVNTAHLLANAGKRVLVIDADPQHNSSTFFLGDDYDDEVAMSTTELMATDDLIFDLLNMPGSSWADMTTPTNRECIDIIPSDIGLIKCDIALTMERIEMRTSVMRFCRALEADNCYDYVLIDCPPNFTAASVAAVIAADMVIIPVKIDAFSLDGLRELYTQLQALDGAKAKTSKKNYKPRILITAYQKAEASRQGEALLRASGVPVYRTVIRRTVRVDESTFARQPLDEYDPRCTAAKDYAAFVAELREEVEQNG